MAQTGVAGRRPADSFTSQKLPFLLHFLSNSHFTNWLGTGGARVEPPSQWHRGGQLRPGLRAQALPCAAGIFLDCGSKKPVFGSYLGRNLVRLRDLVGAPRGRTGLFFRLPGRGGHLGGPATKWGGRGRPAVHAAVNQKDPGFGRFSRSFFEWRFSFFLNRSVGQKTGNLIA
jgi:hypothetical protein